MENYVIHLIENIDQFNDKYNKFYEQSLNGDLEKGVHIIGLDCEYITKNSYPKSYETADWCLNKNDMPIVCKLQLATENICMVIDLCKIGKFLPDNLINILKSESWLKFGAGITADIDCLSNQYNLGNCSGAINASILCRYFGSINPNLENLYNILSKTKDPFKKLELKGNDWSQEMTVPQLKYAAEDACASYVIGLELLNHLKYSLNYLFAKYEQGISEHESINQIKTIEIPVSNENYVGKLMDFIVKNKLKPATFDFSVDINKSNNTKQFYCTCSLDFNDKNIQAKSDGFLNQKKSKHDVSKKILEIIKSSS